MAGLRMVVPSLVGLLGLTAVALAQSPSPYVPLQERELKAVSPERVAAHLEMRTLLTPEQVATYDQLRGNGAGGQRHGHNQGRGHGNGHGRAPMRH